MSIKNMSRPQWIVVVLAFILATGIGGLFARSAVMGALQTTISPSTIKIPYEVGSVIESPSATFKQAAVLYSSGTVTSAQFVTTSRTTSVEVIAKGSYCKGYPKMIINVDGKQQGSTFTVKNTSWSKYTVSTDIAPGTHTVSITFPNDLWRPGRCDRNLYVDSIKVFGDIPFIPDTTVPKVSLTEPKDGSTVSGNTTLTATATDNDKVNKVEFYVDNSLVATATKSPYTFTGDSNQITNGKHTITAKAYDPTGNVGSSSVSVTVANNTTPPEVPVTPPPPTVPVPTPEPTQPTPTYELNVSKPAGGQSVTGNVTFSGTQSNLKNIEVWYNGSSVGRATISGGNWTVSIDTTKQQNGTQQYDVFGWDVAAGQQAGHTVTKPVVVEVNNAAPTPSPTQPTTPSSPSGQEMPVGNQAGWKQIFAEDFTKDAALGTMGSDSDPDKVIYTGTTGTKWVTYPKTYKDTYDKRPYRSDQVLSVHNGTLDFYLHNVDGQPAGANPSPLIDGTSQYQTYGSYSARVKLDTKSLSEYYMAWLLWPQNEGDWQCAESDFPEATLSSSSVSAFAHYGCSGSQDQFGSNIDLTQWHTFTQEWTPGKRSYYVDGKLIGSSTNSVYSKPQRWQLQTETKGTGTHSGHLLVDWVSVYKYDPSTPTTNTSPAVPATGDTKGYFPQATAFTEPVKSSPTIHSDSSAFMSQFKAGNYWNPNFSIGAYGVAVVQGTGQFSAYPSPPPGETSQYLGSAGKIQVPKVPAGTKPASGTDGHLAVIVGNQVYEIYKATVAADGTITNAKAVALANLSGNGQTDQAYAPSDAAGLSLLAGLVTPEELASGHIDHALVFSVPGIKSGNPVFPAWENVAVSNSSGNSVLREADKIQLDPSIDVSALPEPQKTIAKALQKYGAYLRDNGGTFAIYGETSNRWPSSYGTGVSLKDIPWDKVRVLDYNADLAGSSGGSTTTVPATPTPPTTTTASCSNGGIPCVGASTEVGAKQWTLDFSDEFNDSSVDTSKWATLRGPSSPGYGDPYNPDAEDAFYKTANTSETSGNLVFTMKKESTSSNGKSYAYSSGMLQSGRSYSFPPGSYIESNIKVPSCDGCWPAFWTLDTPVDNHWPPEIDIFEFFGTNSDKRPQFNYHWSANGLQQSGPSPNGSLSDYTGAYHTYGLYWTGSKLVPYIDGVAYNAVSNSYVTKANQYIIFNFATGRGSQPADGSKMYVDWVRVWKPKN